MNEVGTDVLHDAAYRYAFRRSLSARLASAAAHEAVLEVRPPRFGSGPPGSGTASTGRNDDERVAVLITARAALERFLPPDLPPRIENDPALRSALAALRPNERELLLLRHWDGLAPAEAAQATDQGADHLTVVEDAVARRLSVARQEDAAGQEDTAELAGRLQRADPAAAISEADLAASRRGVDRGGPTDGPPDPVDAGSGRSDTADRAATPTRSDDSVEPPAPSIRGSRGRRVQTTVGVVCLLALVAVLATVLLPRSATGPSSGVELLYGLADVVAIVSDSAVEPTTVDEEARILQGSVVVQIVKGDADDDVLTVDVTGRSTLERPYSRNFFPPNQLLFLVRNGDGVLSPIEGEGSVLTLVDRRSPEATTISGDPAPLPQELRDAIDALPEPELNLSTSGQEPGALDPADIVGVRPAEGRDAQNLPDNQLGTFRMVAENGKACVWFEFNGRSVVLRWPKGFTAYEREENLSYPDGDPQVGRRVLTVLNERGYPYVDENRSAPFISGAATGDQASCGGQEFDVWDIAVAPGSTLLFY